LGRDGWKVVYLGADTPLADAAALARRLSARLLAISVTTDACAVRLAAAAAVAAGVDVVVGGRAASAELAARLHARLGDGDVSTSVAAMRTLAA
jgi:methanogenic corrinoid protein MtbC1